MTQAYTDFRAVDLPTSHQGCHRSPQTIPRLNHPQWQAKISLRSCILRTKLVFLYFLVMCSSTETHENDYVVEGPEQDRPRLFQIMYTLACKTGLKELAISAAAMTNE